MIVRLCQFCSNASRGGQEGKSFMTHACSTFTDSQGSLGHVSPRSFWAMGKMFTLLHHVVLLKPTLERPSSSLSQCPPRLGYMQHSHGHQWERSLHLQERCYTQVKASQTANKGPLAVRSVPLQPVTFPWLSEMCCLMSNLLNICACDQFPSLLCFLNFKY